MGESNAVTRPRSADAFDEIGRRQREIAAEAGKRIVGDAVVCDCPASPNADGLLIKQHVAGCLVYGIDTYLGSSS